MDVTLLIEIIKYLSAVVLGILLGNACVYFFNKMPAEWFCDYGEKPTKEMRDPYTQRIKSYPWKYTLSMLFVAIGLYLVGDDWVYALAVVFIMWILTELAISDIKYKIVPDQLVILLAVSSLGLIQYHRSWLDMVLGALAGFGIMGVTALIGKLAYRRDTMGGGDIKLFAALGLVTGLAGIVVVFALTALVSAAHMVYLLARKKIKRKDTIPMVPYIAVSAGIYLLFLQQRLDVLIAAL